MPTYEYACDSCGHGFETVQKMSDAPLTACPECGKAVRRVLSGGIAISFKGSGFYVNDAKGSSSSDSKSAASAKGSSSGDAKPAPAACASCPAAASNH